MLSYIQVALRSFYDFYDQHEIDLEKEDEEEESERKERERGIHIRSVILYGRISSCIYYR